LYRKAGLFLCPVGYLWYEKLSSLPVQLVWCTIGGEPDREYPGGKQEVSVQGNKCYVVNSGKAGTGLSISTSFAVDDGYLDVFMLSKDLKSLGAAADRFLNLPTEEASLYYWRGQRISIDADPSQAVWTDGEYLGHTPVAIEVIPGGLSVVVP
jgi:diacylglycerol kinase family enzyme